MNTPCTIAYKLVRVSPSGEMYSVDMSSHQKLHYFHKVKSDKLCMGHGILRYKLRNLTSVGQEVGLPTGSPILQALFVFKDKRSATEAAHVFLEVAEKIFVNGRMEGNKFYLLRGYASNLRAYSEQDAAIQLFKQSGGTLNCMHSRFDSCLCDSFLSLGIVSKWTD